MAEQARKEHSTDPDQPVPYRNRHIDYTQMEHHDEMPDPRDTGDPSRPQGEFWHGNERPGADAIQDVELHRVETR